MYSCTPSPGKVSAGRENIVDDDIIDRVQTACTSILRLILLFKERGLLMDKYLLIIRGLARKLLEQSPETPQSQRSPIIGPHLSPRETANCPVHSPASSPVPPATSSPPRQRRLIAYQPNSTAGEDMPNWQGSYNRANVSCSPASSPIRVASPARSNSAGNLRECEFGIPRSEHRSVSPEELFNSDYLDQLGHISDPGEYENFCPDIMSSKVLEDSNEANLPRRCRKHELQARLKHHHH